MCVYLITEIQEQSLLSDQETLVPPLPEVPQQLD